VMVKNEVPVAQAG